MNTPISIFRNTVLAFLLLGALLWTGFSPMEVASPNAASLFTDYTGSITESDLKTDPFKNEFAIKRRFAKFNFGYFKDQVITPHGKGVKNPVMEVSFFKGEKPMKPKTTAYEYKDGYYHWEGAIEAKFYSQAFFVVNKHGGFGHVQVDDRILSFHPIAYNKEVIMVIEEIDQNKFPSCGSEVEIDKGDPISVPKQAQGGYVIDLLFVYPQPFTSLCEDSFWNNLFPNGILELYTECLTDELNIKYRQEGVIHQITFRGHTFCSDYNPVGRNLNFDMERLRSNRPFLDERDRVNADAVCMITTRGDLCGKAGAPWALNARAAEKAHMIVRNSCAISNHSLAHEMGHLLGLKHERADFPVLNGNPCQFGYYMKIAFNRNDLNNPPLIRRSIMAIGTQADKQGIRNPGRIGLFSDGRDFRFFNAFVRMGIPCNANANNEFEKPANNIQTINMNAPILSNYR